MDRAWPKPWVCPSCGTRWALSVSATHGVRLSGEGFQIKALQDGRFVCCGNVAPWPEIQRPEPGGDWEEI